MDILNKIDILLTDEATVAANVAQNKAQGSVDVVGGECPDGYVWDAKKKVCVKKSDESTVVGGSYVSGTTADIDGSGQTRVVGRRDGEIEVLKRQPRPLKFNKLLGAYLSGYEEEE